MDILELILRLTEYISLGVGGLSWFIMVFLIAPIERKKRFRLFLATAMSLFEALVYFIMRSTPLEAIPEPLPIWFLCTFAEMGVLSFVLMIFDVGGRASFKNIVCNALCFITTVFCWVILY